MFFLVKFMVFYVSYTEKLQLNLNMGRPAPKQVDIKKNKQTKKTTVECLTCMEQNDPWYNSSFSF